MGDDVQTLYLDPEAARIMAKRVNAFDFPIGLLENAFDAVDEVYCDPSMLKGQESIQDLFVKICLDREAKTITIQDNGVGMTKDGLINNVVTSINRYLKGFVQVTQEDDIQRFGGNLFCVFKVSKKFQVVSKHDDGDQFILESSPDSDAFTIRPDEGESLGRGTKVIIFMKETHTHFLQENMIRDLVKKTYYKGLATYPIKIMDTLDVEALICQARSILNFHQSLDKVVEEFDQLQIDTEEKLCQCIELIFEKALDEPSFLMAFGRLFQCLQKKQVLVETLVSGPPPYYSPINMVEPFNFPKHLTGRCRKELKRDYMEEYKAKHKADLVAAADDEDKKADVYASWEDAKRKARTRSMGQIKIIWELYKLKMLKGPAILQMMSLSKDEELFESLCKVLVTTSTTTTNNNNDDLIKSDDRFNFSDLSRELGILEPGHKDACESELASSSVINGFFNVGCDEIETYVSELTRGQH